MRQRINGVRGAGAAWLCDGALVERFLRGDTQPETIPLRDYGRDPQGAQRAERSAHPQHPPFNTPASPSTARNPRRTLRPSRLSLAPTFHQPNLRAPLPYRKYITSHSILPKPSNLRRPLHIFLRLQRISLVLRFASIPTPANSYPFCEPGKTRLMAICRRGDR